jgi:hypothetical protein
MVGLLLIGCLAQVKADVVSKLYYSTPAGTPSKVVEKVAALVEKRIKNYGYKGVIAYPSAGDEVSITVAFDPGFSPQMIQAIDRLASVKGQAYLWACMNMSQKEYEQWIPGKTSPPGTSWLVDGQNKWLMDDTHKVPMDVRFERVTESGQERPLLTFVAGVKLSDHLVQERNTNWKMMMDGKYLTLGGQLRERTSGRGTPMGIYDWLPNTTDDSVLTYMIAISNPFPVELSKKK